MPNEEATPTTPVVSLDEALNALTLRIANLNDRLVPVLAMVSDLEELLNAKKVAERLQEEFDEIEEKLEQANSKLDDARREIERIDLEPVD